MSRFGMGASYLRDREADLGLENMEASWDAARAEDQEELARRQAGLLEEQETLAMGVPPGTERIGRNLLVSMYDSLRNTGEFLLDATVPVKAKGIAQAASQPTLSDLVTGDTGDQTDVDLADVFQEFMGAADQVRDRLAAGSQIEDVLMQKMGQFMVPFTGWLKAFKAGQAVTTAGKVGRVAAADVATNLTAWDPHEGRFADLVREVAPDAMPGVIDYLVSDPDDTDTEGRLKNAIDGAVVNALTGGLLYGTAIAIKRGKVAIMKPRTAVQKPAKEPG